MTLMTSNPRVTPRASSKRGSSFETLSLLAAAAIGLALIVAIPSLMPQSASKNRELNLLAPPEHIEHFTFGYYESAADSLWLRMIQDIDYCDSLKGSVAIFVNNSDNKPNREYEPCKTTKGWVYQMVDAITRLTPKFRAPYIHGATMLSVVLEDKEGARLIFERAIENYPNDWPILYRASYHQLEELQNPTKAAELLTRAGQSGAPAWVYSLAARLYTAEGQAVLAKSMLETVLKEDPESRFAPRLRARLEQLDEIIRSGKTGGGLDQLPDQPDQPGQ
jgi:tetratricopeptide (TPR) repeat protein